MDEAIWSTLREVLLLEQSDSNEVQERYGK